MVYFSPVEKIPLKDVMEKYGSPDCFFESGSGVDNKAPYNMRLYFDDGFLVVYLPEQNNTAYYALEDTMIESFAFFEKEEYSADKIHCQQWKGYGKY